MLLPPSERLLVNILFPFAFVFFVPKTWLPQFFCFPYYHFLLLTSRRVKLHNHTLIFSFSLVFRAVLSFAGFFLVFPSCSFVSLKLLPFIWCCRDYRTSFQVKFFHMFFCGVSVFFSSPNILVLVRCRSVPSLTAQYVCAFWFSLFLLIILPFSLLSFI